MQTFTPQPTLQQPEYNQQQQYTGYQDNQQQQTGYQDNQQPQTGYQDNQQYQYGYQQQQQTGYQDNNQQQAPAEVAAEETQQPAYDYHGNNNAEPQVPMMPDNQQYGYQQQQPPVATSSELPSNEGGLDSQVVSGYQGLDYQASQLAQQNILQSVQNTINKPEEVSPEVSPRGGDKEQPKQGTNDDLVDMFEY